MSERTFGGGPCVLAYVEQFAGEAPQNPAARRASPAILILHGLFGMSDNWTSVVRELARLIGSEGRACRIVTLDMPGHGYSMSPPSMRYEDSAQAVRDFIQEELQGPLVVLGHSLGGKTALKLLADSPPSNVIAFCISDIAPKSYPDAHSHIIAALNAARTADDRKEAEAVLAQHLDDWGLRAYLLKSFIAGSNGGDTSGINLNPKSEDLPRWIEPRLPWLFDLAGVEAEYQELQSTDLAVPKTQLPILWVAGGKSNYIVPETDMPLLDSISERSELVVIEGAGHWVHAEKRREFVQAFSAWYLALDGAAE